MNHVYQGYCHCGKVTFEVTLPRPLDTYGPRACDCDYCTSRGMAYLSDSQGRLELYTSGQ